MRQLFEDSGDPAAPLLRTRRLDVVDEITYWTGVQSSVVRSLVDHLIGRVDALSLCVDSRFPQRYLVSFTAYGLDKCTNVATIAEQQLNPTGTTTISVSPGSLTNTINVQTFVDKDHPIATDKPFNLAVFCQ